MKKYVVIIGFTLFLLITNIIGCIENNEEIIDNKDKLIGTWIAIEYPSDPTLENNTLELNWTFYNNGSVSQQAKILNSDNKSYPVIFIKYELNDNLLCMYIINSNNTICYDYKISNNGKELNLKHESGANIVFYKQ